MLLVPIPRESLLLFLPKGGCVAEIGVARGEFSSHILANASPSKLHLIDPWEHQERNDYQNDDNNAPAEEQNARYAGVLSRFEREIALGKVVAHRKYSQDARSMFPDECFDWIYVDGLHSSEGVKSDLTNYLPKVKPTGFILGHDYTNHHCAKTSGFGVIPAVNEFVMEEGLTFVAMTMEEFPTYALARSPDSAETRLLVQKLSYNMRMLVELRDYPRRGEFIHKVIPFDTGRISQILSF